VEKRNVMKHDRLFILGIIPAVVIPGCCCFGATAIQASY